MKKPVEIAVFGALAVGLHVLVMADWPEQGAEAGGVGGQAMVSLTGATQQIETMVSEWTRPPDVATPVEVAQPVTDAVQETAPQTSIQIDQAPNAALKMAAMAPPKVDTPPQPDVQTFAPPPPPEKPEVRSETTPVPSTPPRARPERRAETPPKPAPQPKSQPKPAPKAEAKPAKKQQKASSGSTAQKAAGTGGTSQAGNSKSAKTKTLSKGQEASLIATWGSRIRSKIERRKRYPSGTRSNGTVTLKVTVDRNGRLLGVSVRRSSGDAKLDNAAVSAVKKAGRFPAAPKQLTSASYPFSIPIRFER